LIAFTVQLNQYAGRTYDFDFPRIVRCLAGHGLRALQPELAPDIVRGPFNAAPNSAANRVGQPDHRGGAAHKAGGDRAATSESVSGLVAEVHDRMPVVLEPARFTPWLENEAGLEILVPAPEGVLQRWPKTREQLKGLEGR
jgi:hypothetical protein